MDISGLLKFEDLKDAAKQETYEAGRNLTAAIHGHIIEQANQKLHTRRQMFIDGLRMAPVNENTWMVSLDAKVRWIDDGMPAHNMIDDLLKSPKAKRAKDGSKYIVVPFQHNKGPTQMTPAQKNLLDTIKSEMMKADNPVPYGSIEKDDQGNPKLGLLHTFDITKRPIKTAEGPGQGHGPIGKVKQGWSPDGKSGVPLLQGVQIHQKMTQNPDGTQSVKRMIMTYRVASSKHKNDRGRWENPGVPPQRIFEEAEEWAHDQWQKHIGPAVASKLFTQIL